MAVSAALEAFNKRKANIPTWRTRYMAQWPNLEPFPDDPSVGVWHMSDIPLAFGTFAGLDIGNGIVVENERMLSSRLMDAWLTFAEVGFAAPLIPCLYADLIPEPHGWSFEASWLAFVRPHRQHHDQDRRAQLFIVLLRTFDAI